MIHVLSVLVSACAIAFAAWLARRFPASAGFVVALPLATLLALPLARWQHADEAAAILMARSIFAALPVTLLFFVPFLLADRFGLGFWRAYAIGCAVLPVGWWLHRAAVARLWGG